MRPELIDLAERYSAGRSDVEIWAEVGQLYERYVAGQEAALMDAAAAATAVTSLFADSVDLDLVTPQMAEAWEAAYSTVELASLADRTPEAIEGFLRGWRGKYFEVIVRDRLNAGEWVGDVGLGVGQTVELAESATQAGWDLLIKDADGSVAELLQLKATDTLRYVRDALVRYPDFEVLTTEETASLLDEALNSGISNEDLASQIMAPMEELLDSPVEELLEVGLVGLPFLVIAISEGRHVLVGRRTVQEALQRAIPRVVKTSAAMLVGWGVFLMEGGLLAIPATFLTRLGIERAYVMRRVNQKLDLRLEQLLRISAASASH